MKRYLAFGGEESPRQHLEDFIGDFDELVMAKAAVEICDPEGWPTHMQGCVLDTKLGQVHSWNADGSQFGKVRWGYPRDVTKA